eukprot:279741-Hanusia_phi.AAC.1
MKRRGGKNGGGGRETRPDITREMHTREERHERIGHVTASRQEGTEDWRRERPGSGDQDKQKRRR